MVLSTTALGSESPNDRISTILDVMTSMRDKMDDLVGKVGNMESKVNYIDHMEELTAEKVIYNNISVSKKPIKLELIMLKSPSSKHILFSKVNSLLCIHDD